MVSLGLYTDSTVLIGPTAAAAERAGFSHLWLYDSPMVFGETSMAAMAAAAATSRIAIGPGVANPSQRPPEYTAQFMATLSLAAPGRAFLGLGVGNSARRSLGLPPVTWGEMSEHARIVRDLLATGEATVRDGDGSRIVRFLHPVAPWIDLSHHVPIWLSAFGPKGQRIAGEQADGVIVRWEGPEAMAVVRARVAEGAGGAPMPQVAVVYAVQPVADDSELDSDAMRAALGPLVVSRLRYLTANASSADEVAPAFRDGFVEYQRYRDSLDPVDRHAENYRGYLVFTPPDLERFVTPAAMRTVALVGPPGRIAEELDLMAESGVDHCSLQIAGDQQAWCERMAREVMPLMTKG